MRIAAYVRVSTDEQASEGNSLTEQTERLRAYCRAMGWPEPAFFTDDGYSAKDLNRKELIRLLAMVENKEIHKVMVTKLDRISRKLLDLLTMIEMFQTYDVSFVSVSEQFDTNTPAGRLTLQVLGAVAEFERERISERVKDNMISLARNTDKVLSKPCYGYDIVNGKYAINEDEAKYVRLMFDLAEEGHGHRMIAKILNDRGATTKLGKPWDQVNVKRLIQNNTISGVMIYNKRQNKNGKLVIRDKSEWIIKENNHQYIVTPERQLRVLQIMRSRKPAKKHADSETYLLTGLVKCGHCERNMKGATSRVRRAEGKSYEYFRYICASYVNGYGCKYHAVHRADLESKVIKEIESLAKSSDKKIKIAVAQSPINVDEIANINAQISKIEKRMQKQIQAYTDDLITSADLKLASDKAEKDRTELIERLEKLQSKKVSMDKIQQNAESLLGEISGVDRVRAKSAIRRLIHSIEILNGQTISIVWNNFV